MATIQARPIEDNETLSRYLQKEKIRSDNTVRSNAFMPPSGDNRVSVYRTDYMQSNEITAAIDRLRAFRPVVGVAKLKPKSIRSLNANGYKLDVAPEESDHKWHANIIGFPPPEERKQIKMLAQKLARAASPAEPL